MDLPAKLSTLSMDTSLCYPRFQPDTESIMSVMHDLKEKNISDNTLLSNLDFAERFLQYHPLKQNSKLLVKGNYSCVQIGDSKQVIFTVRSENNQVFVNVCIHNIYNGGKVLKDSITASHFFNHSCQDEFKSCFTQAQEAVPKEGLTSLQVICNRFSVTYSTQFQSPGPTVETKCRLKLVNFTAEGLLNKKVWLQKEKPTCHGLIACVHYLTKQCLTTSISPLFWYGFVIHADKEIIKICRGEIVNKEYVLLHDDEGISMFPPTL
ncbi:uncharacterized protein LOC125254569 [Megalobrama amblycephala]|uniref:uncharacterized protein LOC125254569 n=1 Tax=Megalobrama amblycephala TaxID=75352 RepID=UPI00201412D5|nr:uncharacterized protein LOC125254569 [Megalobrama amblycephala]